MRSAIVRPLLALLAVACTAPERPERNLLPQPAPAAARGAAPAVPVASGGPSRVPLTVRETAGIGRTGEVVRSGVPLPRSLGVREMAGFAVVDAAGRPVPAEFRVLARWNAGRDDSSAPIQWLLVAFPATVPAKGSAVYSLVTDGSAGPNPPPSHPLRLTRDGQQVVVDTGAAVFRLGGRADALLDEVLLPDGRRLAGVAKVAGGADSAGMELRTARPAAAAGHSHLREVRVESAGPLAAVVVVNGAYDLAPVGTGGFGSRRRYVFTAGSPAVVVRQAVAWEGDLGEGVRTKDGQPNGVRIERARDTLSLDLGGPATALIVGSRDGAPMTAGPGAEASLRQLLRSQRKEPLRFEMATGRERRQGARADAGMLAASGPAGAVAVAIHHMDRYEPQALRLSADGKLAVDLVDGAAWLAHHQGFFATFAVAALPAAPARGDLDRLLWAPLNRPLRAWPDAAWFTASQAVDEVPAGVLPKRYAAYDELIAAALEKTVKSVDAEGLSGLMTWGLYPRYWGSDNYAEVDCKDDPTPGEAWDNPFWCATWTDYHNTTETAAIWAMRSGAVEWLDEIAFPAALRTLHTQILQCGPEQKWFYCGQSPMGYGAYREDFNSSHAYFENLFLYYWLTGDSTVLDLVERGGDSMRRLLCVDRGPGPVTAPHGPDGPACAATHPPDDESVGFTGRAPSQWIAAFRFLGLASGDASFLEDYRSGLARALTQYYAELVRDGRRYGFLGDRVVGKPGPHDAGPFWTNGFYDAENLYRWQRDTGDQPLGEPPLAPSEVLAAVARTVSDLGPRTSGGTPDGPWPRLLTYSWSGQRIGGALTAVEAKDRELYGPEKFGTVALLVRAGRLSGDPALVAAGERMIQNILGRGPKEILPLGKIQGQTLTRLHAAVALAASGTPPK